MRISVCEFLRISTQENWCFIRPGLWANSDNSKQAVYLYDGKFQINSGTTRPQYLTYFQGKPSNVVRANLHRRKRR